MKKEQAISKLNALKDAKETKQHEDLLGRLAQKPDESDLNLEERAELFRVEFNATPPEKKVEFVKADAPQLLAEYAAGETEDEKENNRNKLLHAVLPVVIKYGNWECAQSLIAKKPFKPWETLWCDIAAYSDSAALALYLRQMFLNFGPDDAKNNNPLATSTRPAPLAHALARTDKKRQFMIDSLVIQQGASIEQCLPEALSLVVNAGDQKQFNFLMKEHKPSISTVFYAALRPLNPPMVRYLVAFLESTITIDSPSQRKQLLAQQLQDKELLFLLGGTMVKKDGELFTESETRAAVSILNILCDACPKLVYEVSELCSTPLTAFLARSFDENTNLLYLKALVLANSSFDPVFVVKPEKVAVSGSSTAAIGKTTMDSKEVYGEVCRRSASVASILKGSKLTISDPLLHKKMALKVLCVLFSDSKGRSRLEKADYKAIVDELSCMLRSESLASKDQQTALIDNLDYEACIFVSRILGKDQRGLTAPQESFFGAIGDRRNHLIHQELKTTDTPSRRALQAYLSASDDRDAQEKFRYLDVVASVNKNLFLNALILQIDESLKKKENPHRVYALINKLFVEFYAFLALSKTAQIRLQKHRFDFRLFIANALKNIFDVYATTKNDNVIVALTGALEFFDSLREAGLQKEGDEFNPTIQVIAALTKEMPEHLRNLVLSFADLSSSSLDAKWVEAERLTRKNALDLTRLPDYEKQVSSLADKPTLYNHLVLRDLSKPLEGQDLFEDELLEDARDDNELFNLFYTCCKMESSPKLLVQVMVVLANIMSDKTRLEDAVRFALVGCIITWRDVSEASRKLFPLFCELVGLPRDSKFDDVSKGKLGTLGYDQQNIHALLTAFRNIQPRAFRHLPSRIKEFDKCLGRNTSAGAIWRNVQRILAEANAIAALAKMKTTGKSPADAKVSASPAPAFKQTSKA